MTIWINGAFGAGKSTISKRLVQRIPNAAIYDPEQIGSLIHRTIPESRTRDFQDFPLWRNMTARFALELQEEFGKNLIVPMTIVDIEYLREIFGPLQSSGRPFFHFFLEVEKAELEKRIRGAEDTEACQWRLAQVDRCVSSKSAMPRGTIFLDASRANSEALVGQVLHAIGKRL